jgi:dUTP pyrophosphatase
MINLKIKRLNSEANLPKYKSKEASGMDLVASCNVVIEPNERKRISTDIAVEIPKGYEGQIRPRSGLAFRYGVTVLNSPGTIDSDYRGEIMVILINHGELPFRINKGDRIAQLVISPIVHVTLEETTSLSETQRGEGGFGSTGFKKQRKD